MDFQQCHSVLSKFNLRVIQQTPGTTRPLPHGRGTVFKNVFPQRLCPDRE